MSFTALLHSVSYSGSWGQPALPLSQFIDKAADLGFDGVMLMAKRPHLSPLDYGEKERADLRRHLEKRNLRDLCIAGYNNFTADLEHSEVPHREIQIHYITELARLTGDLGGKLVRIFTGYEHPALGLEGIDAVVDKDLAAAVLARDLGAELLLILTDVDAVYAAWGTADQRAIERLTTAEAVALAEGGAFGAGSMAPKVWAAVDFVRRAGGRAIITSLEKGPDAVLGKAGTTITDHSERS